MLPVARVSSSSRSCRSVAFLGGFDADAGVDEPALVAIVTLRALAAQGAVPGRRLQPLGTPVPAIVALSHRAYAALGAAEPDRAVGLGGRSAVVERTPDGRGERALGRDADVVPVP